MTDAPSHPNGRRPLRRPWETTGTAPSLEERVAALEALVAQLVQPEPEFMSRVRIEPLNGTGALTVRLVHEPTGVTVEASDRTEAVFKLRKALAGRASREFDLQEAERKRQRREAAEASGGD